MKPTIPILDWAMDHPKLSGFLACIALAVTFSPRTTAVGSWVCIIFAGCFEVGMVAGWTKDFKKRIFGSLAILVPLGAFGYWQTHPMFSAPEIFHEWWWLPLCATAAVLVYGLSSKRNPIIFGFGLLTTAIVWVALYDLSPHFSMRSGIFIISSVTEAPPPTGSICLLHLYVNNTGSPSVTSDWEMTARIPNGETVKGLLAWYNSFYTDDISKQTISLEKKNSISSKTEKVPIERGHTEEGHIEFYFPGVRKETLLLPGTQVTLQMRDIYGVTYSHAFTVSSRQINRPIDKLPTSP